VSVDAKYQEKQKKGQEINRLNGFVDKNVNFTFQK